MGDREELDGLIPDELRYGTVNVNNHTTGKMEEYMIILDKMVVELQWINEKPHDKAYHDKQFTFMLVIPREQLIDLMDEITNAVRIVIEQDIFTPLIVISVIMMIIVSLVLKRTSVWITEPIIDLFTRI